ncbi:MAG: hypothetical protein M3137_10335 [Actinomycetota bacterium]|nr:hypothetical protein [Actinomycetota bacterium]
MLFYAATLVTHAPEAVDESIETLVAQWRTEIDGQISVSASTVQDHLLELWGRLPDSDVRHDIEQWLTETLQRNLYQVSDIDARLTSVVPSTPEV